MRLAFLINDKEYEKALIRSITESGADIQIDVICKGEKIEPDALIVTDARPADIDGGLLVDIKERAVFLSSGIPSFRNNSISEIFKYTAVSRLLAQISEVYHKWQGIKSYNSEISRIIACCSDSDAFSGLRCTRVARQIIYRHGGRVLILPLGYINEHACDFGRNINNFARIIYQIRKGRTLSPQSVAYTDSYGISRFMIPAGRNPIAYLDGDDLAALIHALSEIFDAVILDIAGCYRPENLSLINNASSVLCFETGRRRINFEELISPESAAELKIIKADDGSDEDLLIDEYIDELFGG